MRTEIDNNSLICGIHHIAVRTVDREASLHLYRDILGMRVVNDFELPGRHLTLLAVGDGSHIELIAHSGSLPFNTVSMPVSPLLHIALCSTDVNAVIELVRKAGFRIDVETKDVSFGQQQATIAFFAGPSGESIELFQPR